MSDAWIFRIALVVIADGLAGVGEKHGVGVAFAWLQQADRKILLGDGIRGCKPEPQKFPSPQNQPSHECIQVNELAIALEGVVPVKQDVLPGRW